jgi:hypothetical protein
MRHLLPQVALLAVPFFCPSLSSHATLASTFDQPVEAARQPYGEQRVVRGRVTHVHAPRLFNIEAEEAAVDREWLVLAPRALSTPVIGATVEIRGVVRRFEESELKDAAWWKDIDEPARAELARRPVLVASSLIATMGGELMRLAAEPQAGLARVSLPPGQRPPLTVRPATLVDHIEVLAGHNVRIWNARVVGVFEPNAFLIETASRYEELLGHRDRVLVLIDAASLRVPAATIVASTVTIFGVARTLVGVQVTSEVPWPTRLDRRLVERLEVRAAVLAKSVQTPEGTELTDRPSSR